MRKQLPHIISAALVITLIGVAVVPHVSFASEGGVTSWISGAFIKLVKPELDTIVGTLAYYALTIASKLVWMTGTLLNAAMSATFSMSTIMQGSSAVASTWKIVRDISSMLFIFFLLSASIQTMLGVGKASIGNVIKNVIIAGVFINLSLFIVRIGIDASNLVSLGFYNAIAPNSEKYDGGLSDAFMQSLRVNTVYDSKGVAATKGPGDKDIQYAPAQKTLMAGVMGSMIMMITASSFFTAALLVLARIGLLLVVLILSPVYFLSLVLPKAGDYGKKLKDLYIAQLTFLPVYLMLNYVALRLITSDEFKAMFIQRSSGETFSELFIGGSATAMGVLVNYVVVIVLINTALAAALGSAKKVTDLTGGKFDFGKYVSKKSGDLRSFVGRQTYGRAANAISNSETLKDKAATNMFARGLYKGVKGAAKNYNEEIDKKAEERQKFIASLGYNGSMIEDEEKELLAKKIQLNTLNDNLKEARAKGVADDIEKAEEALKEQKESIRATNYTIDAVKNSRSQAYQTKVEKASWMTSPWMKLTGYDDQAAKKLQLKTHEKDLEKLKDGLKETNGDLKDLEKKLRDGSLTDSGRKEIEELRKDRDDKMKKVAEKEKLIKEMKG